MTRGKKPVEIELKLVLTGQGAESAIVAKMRENKYAIKELDKLRNIDIYLDTFDWLLMKSKLALRYRVTDGAAMYTIKSIGTIGGGIAKRMETEVPLEAPVDAPSEIHIKQIRELIDPVIYPRKLLEHIQIRTERRRYHALTPKGAEIELAFDTSCFSLRGLHKPRRAQQLQEMEAEIIDGSEAALKSLALLLSREFPYPPSTASKLEVAIDRLKIVIPSKKLPEKLRVRLDDRLDLTVHKILHYQFSRFREQIPGVKRDIDTEFVHQARVATRRMRSALRLFRNAVPHATGTYLEGELKWLGETFGAVRDLDVFLLNLSRFKEQIQHFPGKKKKVFEDWIEKHRRTPVKALINALESPRYESFERRLIKFFEGPLAARPRATQAVKLVREMAPMIITDKLDSVIEQGRTVLENPKLKEFHRLRIQMKRLRYACEFMAPAYDGALAPFIDHTVELQDCLGEIQDTVFTREFIDYLFEDWKDKLVEPVVVFILGEIYQLQGEIAKERQEGFKKIWERFASEETIRHLNETLSIQTAEEK
ncbi:MAG TPA: CHAD domain-containing protein [Syntrophales bacterium]|nr:CHAD domain-containing protein [Syntrophales bacterium]